MTRVGGSGRDSRRTGRAEIRQRGAGEHAAIGVIIVVGDGVVVYSNSAASELLGVPKEDLLGKAKALMERFVHDDDVSQVALRFNARSENVPIPNRFVFRVLRPDRRVWWVELQIAEILYNGQQAFLANFFDATAQLDRIWCSTPGTPCPRAAP